MSKEKKGGDNNVGDVPAPLTLAEVLSDELEHNRPKSAIPARTLDEAFQQLHDAELTALCFSGGGIRSATFGLGIVQALAKHKLLTKFDYLSTVSGGGYLGSWLSAWVHREGNGSTQKGDGAKPVDFGITRVQDTINCRPIEGSIKPNPEPSQLQHLREFSNYMSPKRGMLSIDTWTLIAIYLRNLLLNLSIFLPLIAAVLMLPRIFFRALDPNPSADAQFRLLVLALILGSVAIAFVIIRLPSKASKREEEGSVDEREGFLKQLRAFSNTDAGVLLFGVGPLLISAFILTTLWAWSQKENGKLAEAPLLQFKFGLDAPQSLIYFLIATVAAFAFGILLYKVVRWNKGFGWWAALAALASSLLGGVILWLVTTRALPDPAKRIDLWLGEYGRFGWPIYFTLAVPALLLIILICATVFVGLTSRRMTDEDREWLGRFGAWTLFTSGIWVSINVLVLLGPSLFESVFNFGPDKSPSFIGWLPITSSTITAISAVVSLVGGFSERSHVRNEGVKTTGSRILAVAPQVAAVVFFIAIFIFIAWLTSLLLTTVGSTLETKDSQDVFPTVYEHLHVLNESGFLYLLLVAVLLGAIGFFMACYVNVNKFSLHGSYRDRLIRAYLGASNLKRKKDTFIGFDDGDNLELHELQNQRPLHIINAAVNLVGGKKLAWQNRKAASFTMSPLHCGSWAVKGYRKSKDYCRNSNIGKSIRLGTAMAISGAAANPNMGYYSSTVVTFLMALFNIRLGWWLGNTGDPGSKRDLLPWSRRPFYTKPNPSIAILPLLNETLGRTDETKKFLNVSDGGHFENLAIYEMVLRRCRLIVLSDGAADADFKFGEIANAIQKCKVDLGADIKFLGAMNIYGRNSKEEGEVKKARFAIAQITYPERNAKGENYTGWLLYTRPTYYGTTEPRDVRYYADANAKFPHQSTGDQMYDEKQFEAYRSLGFLTMEEVINECNLADFLRTLGQRTTRGLKISKKRKQAAVVAGAAVANDD